MPQRPLPRATLSAVGRTPNTRAPEAGPRNNTLDEERRELVAGVLSTLASHQPDPDEMAACSYLLRHLSRSGDRPAA